MNYLKLRYRTASLAGLVVILLWGSGCSPIEFSKGLWGSSTKALEKGRATAIQKTYHCSVTECFDAVLALTVKPKEEYLTDSELAEKAKADKEKADKEGLTANPGAAVISPQNKPSSHTYGAGVAADNPALPITPPSTTYLDLFIKNRKKDFIVVMGIPNCVNTTEVGIYFTPTDAGNVKVELSSLSTKAKRKAAEIVFDELGKKFPEIP